jgi:hypothetical protein
LRPAPSVEIIARDAFVTDMAIKVDQVRMEVRALAREIEGVKAGMAVLREDTDRNYRFSAFQEKEQRARREKIDHILRRYRDITSRLESIFAREGGGISADSFEVVKRQIGELDSLRREFRGVARKLKLSAALFCGSVFLWLVTLLSS